jgi:flavin-dependent dehydrogenase
VTLNPNVGSVEAETMQKFDVLIVGAGPAGSACAWRLQRGGVKCLLLDQNNFPRSKPCAGWITPQVIKDLDMKVDAYPYSFTTFPELHISLRGIPVSLRGAQHAIRRVEFDQWLLQRSETPMVVHRVKEIRQMGEGYTIDGKYFGRYLVGAGGTHCPVYHTLFKSFSPRAEGSRIVAREQEFPYPWKDGRCRLWFFDQGLPGYSWYLPKAGGYVNVGVGGSAKGLKNQGRNITDYWQKLVEKLARLDLVVDHNYQPLSHVYYLHHKHPQLEKDGAYLVGDSAGLATLDMGEGIGPAIKSGLLAAEAILNNQIYSVASIPKVSLLPKILQWIVR